eukprot:jgi/Chrzof1/1480/Cz10g09130.t1
MHVHESTFIPYSKVVYPDVAVVALPNTDIVVLQVKSSAHTIVKRLRLLQEYTALMDKLTSSSAVAGVLRAMLLSQADSCPPAVWWNTEADLALLAGVYRHGYANYEAVRRDPDYADAFQVRPATIAT